MTARLFVYGSLQPGHQNEHVLAHVQGRWRRGSVRGRLLEAGWGSVLGYPALVLEEEGEAVSGRVLESRDLDGMWDALDAFEGEEYRRVPVRVELEDGSVTDAQVYVLREFPQSPG